MPPAQSRWSTTPSSPTHGALGQDPVVATVLESRGLSRAEAKRASSYTPGDVVTFREAAKGKPRPGVGYRIDAIDAQTGTVRLVPPNPKAKTHDWKPARWGSAYAEAFAEVPQEFRTGDKVQFTRNNYSAERLNGSTSIVVAVDPQGSSVLVEKDDGERQMLDLRHLADRHVRPGWVRTIHSAQGATCDRVMARLESFRANTVDTRAAYVAISAPAKRPRSTPTAAPSSPRHSGCATGRRSARSMRQWGDIGQRSASTAPADKTASRLSRLL